MPSETQLDIRIGSTDTSVVELMEVPLMSLNPVRLDEHRDIATIITVASSVVALTSQLIDLWKKLKEMNDPPAVEVEAESGFVLDLVKATHEEIEKFVQDSTGSEP